MKIETTIHPNGVERRNSPEVQAKESLNRDVETIREELRVLIKWNSIWSDGGSYWDYLGTKNGWVIQEAADLITQWWEATAKFVDETMFHNLSDIYDATWGNHETIVGMQTADSGEITSVNELGSTDKSHSSVSYKAEDLANTQAVSHNHPTESKKEWEVVLQWFSEQDKLTNQRTEGKITETQWADAAQKYTHFLGKEYRIGGQSYQTVIASGLNNDNNMKRQKLMVWDKMYYQAIRCPDGQIKDVMDLPEEIAAKILYERLMAVDNSNDDFINMAA